jgi:hypothetical protein
MALILLFHSLVFISVIIYLKFSITIGSIGLLTRLFCFLNVFDVVLNPYDPIVEIPPPFMKVLYISELLLKCPNPSLPEAICYALKAPPTLRLSIEVARMLVPYLVEPLILTESISLLSSI